MELAPTPRDDTDPGLMGRRLSDMPAEIIANIVNFIEEPRTLYVAQCASSLFSGRSVGEMAAQRYAHCIRTLFGSGAPLWVIERAMTLRNTPLPVNVIEDAIKGGRRNTHKSRIDVLRLIVCAFNSQGATARPDPIDGLPHNIADVPPLVKKEAIIKALADATTTAASVGCVASVRYLHREALALSPQLDVSLGIACAAARAGHLDCFVYAHDIQIARSSTLCRCTADVGNAAWEAPKPDIITWMRENRCAGIVPLKALHVACAISATGSSTEMVAYMAKESPDLAGDIEIQRAVRTAASSGRIDMLTLMVETGMCRGYAPILAGAAKRNVTDVLAWACDESGPCFARLGPPDQESIDVAMSTASGNGEPQCLVWLVEHFTSTVTPASLMWSALICEKVSAMRAIDAILVKPFPWGSALARALRTGRVHAARYIVEEKGVAITPEVLADASTIKEAVAKYVCESMTRDQLQETIDTMGSISQARYQKYIERIRQHAPDLCVATVRAMDIDQTLLGLEATPEYASPCSCARCTSDGNRIARRASMPPPAKRRRVESDAPTMIQCDEKNGAGKP
ncbi:hypothetical protein pmac_cds_171 [Pandoravirus macleodensis]|uniref:F-box incomplete domain containing protein n=1 Tax=Pandoravirus macleodensis TaxID=2107707 RepID=A0A2U7UEG0_9VIRU|nr:hypothetical protein pmac_cds_171 [Pandoravirus macleodensis]AVK76859.1 hypothetical protein pmac_cds_171 [Pandoravirus macleodensis]